MGSFPSSMRNVPTSLMENEYVKMKTNTGETYYFHSHSLESQITNNIEKELGANLLGLFIPQNNRINVRLNTPTFYATSTPNRNDIAISSTANASDLRMYITQFCFERRINPEFSSFETVGSSTSFGKKNRLAEVNRDIKILNKIT
jgi:hypothetical protein